MSSCKIVSLEAIIEQSKNKETEEISSSTDDTTVTSTSTKKKKIKEQKPENLIPRGQPKSGKFWKSPKTRASKLIATRGIKRSNAFDKKEKLRADLKASKELSRQILADRKRTIEEKKERRRANLKRQEENRKRSEIVQVIKNPAKIKRMRKKQLRNIEKRDTLNMA